MCFGEVIFQEDFLFISKCGFDYFICNLRLEWGASVVVPVGSVEQLLQYLYLA